jgi:hypothetical protein
MMAADQGKSRRNSSTVVSAEKVENVVSPPRKPVVAARRSSGGTATERPKYSMHSPMMKPPMRFEASVPKGIVGNTGFSHAPRRQRSNAPSAAPMPTAKPCQIMDSMLLDFSAAWQVA